MSSQSIPQRMSHKVFDLLLHYWETNPELAEEERINTTAIEKPDALAVLNAAWRRGALTEEEYRTIYNRLNRAHGEWCACGEGQAVYTDPETGAHLCGACALEMLS